MANNNDEGVNNNSESPGGARPDQSIVGKFVSNIISTTPFSKWFSKETDRNPGEVRGRDDYDDDDLSTILQPVKRAKTSHVTTESNNINLKPFESPVNNKKTINSVNNDSIIPKFPEPVAGPSGINWKRFHEAQNGNESDSSEDIEISNHTASASIQPTPVQSETLPDLDKPEFGDKAANKPRSLFTSSSDLHQPRSLFQFERSPKSSSLSSRRPNFNASTLGSSSFVDRTLSTKRILNSPFYTGNTVYGGASAYVRSFGRSADDLFKPSNRRNSIHIKPITDANRSTSESSTMSKTARRILTALEQYSTPISDAKKIPIAPKRDGALSQFIGHSPYTVRKKVPSQRELQVPELLKMKQRAKLQNSTVAVREIASSSKPNPEEYKIRCDDKSAKSTNKMKSSVTSSTRSKAQVNEDVVEVNLPKVSLPITNLPKFDLVMMPPPPKPSSTIVEIKSLPTRSTSILTKPQQNETDVNIKKATFCEPKSPTFTFSEPLKLADKATTITPINCFSFTAPKNVQDETTPVVNFKMPENNNNTDIKAKPKKINGDFNFSKPDNSLLKTGSVMDVLGKKSKPVTWECQICLVINDNNKTECAACAEPNPLADTIKSNLIEKSFGNKFTTSDTWECSVCMIRNDNKLEKCAACTSARSIAKTSTKTNNQAFGSEFKKPTDSWECQTCLIRNKNELSKCQACETARNGTASINKSTVNSPKVASSWGDQFKPKSDTWECTACLVRNKCDTTKCVACSTLKPGAKEEIVVAKQTTSPKFSFGIPQKETQTSSSNKSGEDWGCPTCLVQNKRDSKSCVCCNMLRNSSVPCDIIKGKKSEPVSSFYFGIEPIKTSNSTPEKKLQSNQDVSIVFPVAEMKPETTPTFSFGVKPQEKKSTTENSTNLLFKSNDKQQENKTLVGDGLKFAASEPKSEPLKPIFEYKSPVKNVVIDGDAGFFPSPSTAKPTTTAPMFKFEANKSPAFGANKSSEALTIFKSKPAESGFSAKSPIKTNEAPSFNYTVAKKEAAGNAAASFKFETNPPQASTSQAPSVAPPSAMFKFGGSSPVKRTFDATEMNGIGGSTSKMASFANSTPAFGFNAPAAASSKPNATFSFGGETNKPTSNGSGIFSFSNAAPSANAQSQPANAGFNFSVTSVPNTGFNFGGTSEKKEAGNFGSMVTMTPTGNSIFGASGAPNGTFNFGSNVNNNNQKAIFSFGGSQTNQGGLGAPPPQQQQQQPQASFSFGGPAPAPAVPIPGAFNFNGPPPSFSFTDGTASSQSQRRFKKAVRRTVQR